MSTPPDRSAAPRRPLKRRRRLSFGHRTSAQPLDAAGQARVVAHIWLARQLAWVFLRHYARDMPIDELKAEALYALTYAAGLYSEDRGVPFDSYARMVIRHRLIQVIQAWRRARRAGPFPTSLTPTPSSDPAIEDRPADIGIETVVSEMCDQVRQALPARLYDMLRLYHGEGHTLDEIGARYGVSRQRVGQLLVEASNWARGAFPEWSRY